MQNNTIIKTCRMFEKMCDKNYLLNTNNQQVTKQ